MGGRVAPRAVVPLAYSVLSSSLLLLWVCEGPLHEGEVRSEKNSEEEETYLHVSHVVENRVPAEVRVSEDVHGRAEGAYPLPQPIAPDGLGQVLVEQVLLLRDQVVPGDEVGEGDHDGPRRGESAPVVSVREGESLPVAAGGLLLEAVLQVS